MSEHSTLPWEARQDLPSPQNNERLPGMENHACDWGIYAHKGRAMIARIEEATHRHLPTETANARFIIRACNCHDDLVEHLRWCVQYIGWVHAAYPHGLFDDAARTAMGQCQTALANAAGARHSTEREGR